MSSVWVARRRRNINRKLFVSLPRARSWISIRAIVSLISLERLTRQHTKTRGRGTGVHCLLMRKTEAITGLEKINILPLFVPFAKNEILLELIIFDPMAGARNIQIQHSPKSYEGAAGMAKTAPRRDSDNGPNAGAQIANHEQSRLGQSVSDESPCLPFTDSSQSL